MAYFTEPMTEEFRKALEEDLIKIEKEKKPKKTGQGKSAEKKD